MVGIYKITNRINGKVYVGQSVDIKKRWNEHIYAHSGKGSLIHKAIRKYGKENFDFSILCECDASELNKMEQSFISQLNSIHPNGYNLTSGGGQGVFYSDATKKKISESKLGDKNPNFGKHRSEDTRKKIGDSQKGRKLSPEQIEKMRITNTGRCLSEETKTKISASLKGENNPRWGKHLAYESKQKISQAHKGRMCGSENPAKRDDVRLKISQSKLGDKNPSKRTDVRDKISQSRKGQRLSTETKAKLSVAHRNISESTRQKMRNSHKGKSLPKYDWIFPDGHISSMPMNVAQRLINQGKDIKKI